MSYSAIKSPVYCNYKYLDLGVNNVPAKIKAPQIIGDIWARIQASKEGDPALPSLLEKLGVAKGDVRAQEILLPLIRTVLQDGTVIEATDTVGDSGVYFLKTAAGKTIGVFKVGTKRAQWEILAAKIARKLGLEKHAIPGVFCSIANPPFPKEAIIEELWNGNQKLYKSVGEKRSYSEGAKSDNEGLDEPYTLTGILEPYLSSNEENSISDFASMTMYALAIGLRDAKPEGIIGSTLIDVEECMPARVIPDQSPDRHVAATHLPYLTHPYATAPIPLDIFRELSGKVDGCIQNIFSILKDLEKEEIEYADRASEDLISVDDFIAVANKLDSLALKLADKNFVRCNQEELDTLFESIRKDWEAKASEVNLENTLEIIKQLYSDDSNQFKKAIELACTVWDEKSADQLALVIKGACSGWDHGGLYTQIEKTPRIMESNTTVDLSKTKRLLSDAQISAFTQRMFGLQHFLKQVPLEKFPTTLEMVYCVDPLYKAHADALNKANYRHHPADVVGRFPPSRSASLGSEAIKGLQPPTRPFARALFPD